MMIGFLDCLKRERDISIKAITSVGKMAFRGNSPLIVHVFKAKPHLTLSYMAKKLSRLSGSALPLKSGDSACWVNIWINGARKIKHCIKNRAWATKLCWNSLRYNTTWYSLCSKM